MEDRSKKLEHRVYQFGSFRLDVRQRRLYQGSEQVHIPSRTCEVLLLLVERAGFLVEKDEIHDRIWPDQFIEESNLSQHIYRLRKILGDKGKDADCITTVPGKGYVFSLDVQMITAGLAEDVGPDEDGVASRTGGNEQRQWRGLVTGQKGVLTLAVFMLVLLGGLLILVQSRPTQSAGEELPRVRPLVTLPGEEGDLSFSPDGRYLAFTSEGETRDNQDIYVRMIDQDVMWRVTSHPDKDTQAVWSPDGTRIAFLRNTGQFAKPNKLIVIPVRGGIEREIGEVWGGLSWSPDGKYLAVSSNNEIGTPTRLCLISPDGGERSFLTLPPVNVFDTNQQFSPDGDQIAFVRWKNNSNSDLFVLTLSTGELKQLTFDESVISDYHWGDDGEAIYFVSNRRDNTRLWRITAEGGAPLPVPNAPLNLISIAISPNGRHLAFTQPTTDTQIDIFKTAITSSSSTSSMRISCKINSSQADDSPRFSPDGSRMVYISTRSGSDEIWIANSDCSNQVQLTRFDQRGVGSPRWSPDGQRIVFDRNVSDNTDIFTIGVDGTDLRQLTTDPAVENMPAWSGDGKWIYFGSYKSSISRIYRIPSGGGESEPVTKSPGSESIESADGQFLYYTNSDRLWQKELPAGQEMMIPELAETHIGRYWDLAGGKLYFISHQPGGAPIVVTFDLKSRKFGQLFDLHGSLARWVPGIAFAPKTNLIAVGYVTNRQGDISLADGWR